MLKEILVVSGKPGLFRLVSRGNNLLVVESLTDKKRIPAYTRDKAISLGDITVFTNDGDVSVGEVLTKIKEKEDGKNLSIDLSKAGADELRAYLAEVLPNFDRDRIYPTEIKKMLKWYELLMNNGITDFIQKDEAETVDAAKDEKETPDDENEAQNAAASIKTPQAAIPVSGKRKGSISSVKPLKATATKPMPKSATPKKSVVGAKRGS